MTCRNQNGQKPKYFEGTKRVQKQRGKEKRGTSGEGHGSVAQRSGGNQTWLFWSAKQIKNTQVMVCHVSSKSFWLHVAEMRIDYLLHPNFDCVFMGVVGETNIVSGPWPLRRHVEIKSHAAEVCNSSACYLIGC